ncbi:NlpC/P60 family protein [Thermobacillus sp. ZCTH02-B1]|uniref:C40 family peptidase n=1 Tax=Thermobacillus sp. ZCTH02-B1 TaxID=1858795 RepID=UPI0025EA1D99|nr:NlpC/P60 family protein [Thermobacillus sp. ZCTH02-B1]
MRRLTILGLILTLAAGLFAGQASAATYETKVLYGVNLRSAPSTSASIYRMLSKGESIHVIQKVNDYWLKVQTKDGKIGYISASSKYTDYIGGSAGSGTKAATGSAIVATAKSYLGKFTYKYGAEPWNTNYKYSDCSAFVQLVFNRHHGFKLPRTSAAQAKQGKFVSKSSLKPGDLVFFDTNGNGSVNHVGIYIGGGDFIHCSPANKVGINTLNSGYWKTKYKTARRVL